MIALICFAGAYARTSILICKRSTGVRNCGKAAGATPGDLFQHILQHIRALIVLATRISARWSFCNNIFICGLPECQPGTPLIVSRSWIIGLVEIHGSIGGILPVTSPLSSSHSVDFLVTS